MMDFWFEGMFADTLLEKYFLDGGPMMFVLLPVSLLMLGAVLQGMIRLRKGRVSPPRLGRAASAARGCEGRRAFVASLAEDQSPLGRVLWLALKDGPTATGGAAQTPAAIAPDVVAATTEVADDMHEGLGLLATIYTIAPLLGLMGTILGMMDAFYKFALIEGDQTVGRLSEGIQQALVTTLWGLGIAIPAFVAAQALHGMIRRHERVHLPREAEHVIRALAVPDSEPRTELAISMAAEAGR